MTVTITAALVLTAFELTANATIFPSGIVNSILNRATDLGYHRRGHVNYVIHPRWNQGPYYWTNGSHGGWHTNTRGWYYDGSVCW